MHSILVVEDDEAIRAALFDALTDEGYDADCFSDGNHALRHLEQRTVDLVLVDVYMPAMTGTDMVRRLRRRGDETPIIMMSAQPAQSLPLDVKFLRKPFDLDRLFQTIQDSLKP